MASTDEDQPVSVANVLALDEQRRKEYGTALSMDGGTLKLTNAAGESLGNAPLDAIPVSFIEAL